MDRRSFNNLSFYYRVYEEKMISYSDSSLKLEMFRFDIIGLAYSNSIIITPNYFYINNMLLDYMKAEDIKVEEFMRNLSKSRDGEYTFYSDSMMFLDEKELTRKKRNDKLTSAMFSSKRDDVRYRLNKFESTPWMYYYFMVSTEFSKKSYISRYALLNSEKEWYEKFSKILKEKDQILIYPMHNYMHTIEESMKSNEQMRSLLNEYKEAVYDFRTTRKEYETLTLKSDYMTVFSSYLVENLTYNRLKFWEMTRHNLFGEVVCQSMSWEYDGPFDINVSEMFNYWGVNYNRTPDYVMEMNDKIYLIDFAVTNANAGFIRDKKKIWYENLRDGLSKHLEKEVVVEAIVWKINSNNEFQIPSEFMTLKDRLTDNDVIRKLSEVELGFMMMHDYSKYKKMTDRESEEEEMMDENVLAASERVLSHMDSMMSFSTEMKSIPMEVSRMDTEDWMNTKKLLKESEFYKDMKSFNESFDEVEYVSGLTIKMEDMIRGNKMSKEMSKTLDFNLDELKIQSENIKKNQIKLRRDFEMDHNNDISSIMKFPYMDFKKYKSEDMKYFLGVTPDFWASVHSTDDGTYYYTSTMDFEEKRREEEKEKNKPYNVMGIGSNFEEDESMVEAMQEFLMEDETTFQDDRPTVEMKDYMDYPDMDKKLQRVINSRLWTYVSCISELMENLCYLEGRRHILDSKNGHTVFKNFGDYMVLMKKGSKLTQDKQIRFKVFMGKDSFRNFIPGVFKSMKASHTSNLLVESSWLAITLADIKHFVRIKEVVLGMFSNFNDKMIEENRGTNFDYEVMNKSMVTQCLVMMEHRRGTSTTAQLNRYLLNSVTSFCTNRPKMMDDIYSEPIRSRLESYIRIKQLQWYTHCLSKSEEIWYNRIVNMASTSTDYDRFRLPSFYDLEKEVEFSILMDEIYSSNLFEKSSGFKSHRLKRIVEKMAVAEMHFQKVKKTEESMGKIDDVESFLTSKDELHTFDRRYVVASTRKFFKNSRNKTKIKTAVMKALSQTIDSAMMMTSSLEAGPYHSECLEYDAEVKKDKTFLTIYRKVRELSTNSLLHMCNKLKIIDAIFTIFPKDQIGGAREILIQSIMLRLQVKFFETINIELCRIHEKEMITKDKKRAEIQGDRMMEYKEMLRNLRKKNNPSMYASMNSDASKWAPGFVMEHFSYSISNWGLDDNLESFMLSVVNSFSNKKILMPESLKKKWDLKPNDEKEMLDGVQYTREMTEKLAGTIIVNSGMGQGMFHKASSFKHCIEDDLTDEIIEKVMWRVYSIQMHQTSLISSDDKTKMMIFIYRSGYSKAEEAMKSYVKLLDWCSRLGNIHTNWKKSGLNFTITEFNSLFSVGRRMQWALIKDLYNANSVPDLTSPEEAVVFMNANLRRCFEHGMYLTTLKLLAWMARKQLMRYYKISKEIVLELTTLLNCREEDLPFQLGFFPTSMVVEQILFGMEVNMFKENRSVELNSFYWNLYSYKPGTNYKVAKKLVPFSEDCMGKYWYELPMRLDKKLSKLRNDFYDNELQMTTDNLMEESNHFKLNHNTVKTDMKSFNVFSEEFFMGMKRKYEFQETMVVHSLIRALQLSKSMGKRFPLTESEEITNDEFHEKLKEVMRKKKKGEDYQKDEEECYALKLKVETFSKDLLYFAREIMYMNSESSSITMYSGLKEIVKIKETVEKEISDMSKSSKYTHTMMRTMRFYMNDIGSMASKEEIVDFMFNKGVDFRAATVNSTKKMLDMANLTVNDDMYNNPFKVIKKIFSTAKYPNKVFSEFLTLNNKSMKFMKVVMLSDLPCEGNVKMNLTNWYRTKSNPDYFLIPKDKDFLREESSLEFLTNISMNLPTANMDSPENYYKLSISDNILMKTMKLHSISKTNWMPSTQVTSDRIEYRIFHKKDRNSTYRMWTNFDVLVKAEETPKNCYISINSSYDLNLDSSSDNMIMVIKRFMREMREKGKLVVFLHKEASLIDKSLEYIIRPMFWKTKIVRTMTYWRIKMIMDATTIVKNKNNIEDMNSAEFNLFKDSYTVDSRSLMNMDIIDQYEDKIKVQDLYMDIPDLVSLDKIFLANSWLREIEIQKGSELDDKTKFSVRQLNESFGITSMDSTLSKMLSGSNTWNMMLNQKTKEAEDNNTPIEPHISNMDFKIPEKGILDSLMRALKVVEDSDEEMTIEFEPYERNSIIKNIDFLVKSSMTTNLTIYKDKMKEYYRYLKRNKKDLEKFHDMLLWQIRKALDFEISNTMTIVIYNHIIRNSSSFLELKPSDSFKILPDNFTMPESLIFIKPILQYDEDMEEVLRRMD
nr:RNA-dependent RNA polymerase [Erysiphe necator associated negative-stranded RNA virus 13]